MDIRGVYMFSSLMKQNKKAKICFVICFAGKKKLLFYIYAVIVKQKIYKRSSNYYSQVIVSPRGREQYGPEEHCRLFVRSFGVTCNPGMTFDLTPLGICNYVDHNDSKNRNR
jgi:hypothetical protein